MRCQVTCKSVAHLHFNTHTRTHELTTQLAYPSFLAFCNVQGGSENEMNDDRNSHGISPRIREADRMSAADPPHCPNAATDCGGYCWICPPPAEPKESAE